MALPRSRAVASPPRRSQAATQSNRGQSLSPLPARLFVDEKTGLDRNNEILLGGLPLSQGLLRQGGWFNLKNAAGKRFAVEGTPAAWWPDGSIKWLHLCGAADLAGGKTQRLRPLARIPGRQAWRPGRHVG